MRVVIDIESIPGQPKSRIIDAIAKGVTPPAQMKKPDTIKAWMEGTGDYVGVRDALIEESYRKTALDGGRGQLCCASFAVEDSEQVHSLFLMPAIPANEIEPPFYIQNGGMIVHTESEFLRKLFDAIGQEIGGLPSMFVGHNIVFDLKFLFHRAVINQVNPGLRLNQSGKHDQHFYDTMEAWAGFRGYIKLDELCDILGIEQPADEIDGSKVWECYQAAEYGKILNHNIADIKRVQQVYKHLTFSL